NVLAEVTARLPGHPVSLADRSGGLGQPPGGGQKQGKGQVRSGVGEHVGGVADRDRARGGRLEVDVVVTGGVVGNGPQSGRSLDQLGVDTIGQQRQQTFGLGGAAAQFL